METVNNKIEIKKNLDLFFSYGKSNNEEELTFFLERVKRGTCFLVLENNGELIFAPSRFIGYKSNDMRKHLNNDEKDGRITNGAIQNILEVLPKLSCYLDDEYSKYCQRLGFIANASGTFGVPRKFWLFGLFPKTNMLTQDVFSANSNLSNDIITIAESNIDETVKESMILARVGQGMFRDNLISFWKKCPITNCDHVELLTASHIKPWKYSDNNERLSYFNGILLSPNYNSLFDRGFISFNDNGTIIISKSISERNLKLLNISRDIKINFRKEHYKFLKYHRNHIFIKSWV